MSLKTLEMVGAVIQLFLAEFAIFCYLLLAKYTNTLILIVAVPYI